MSSAESPAERAKYRRLLELAHQQVQALSAEDYAAFDQIVESKRTIVDTLENAHEVVSTDPALTKAVEKIQECDKISQRLIYQKIGSIMRDMTRIQNQNKARRAYLKPKSLPLAPKIDIPYDVPWLFDKRS